MYVGSILGSGILVMPSIAATIAGPASLVAWVLLALLSYPIGYTFGALAAAYPDAGGLSAFVKRGFGWTLGTIAGWIFVFSFFVGAPIVAIIVSHYILAALSLPETLLYPIAFVFMGFTVLVNFFGLRIGSRTESAVLATVLILLFAVAALALPHVSFANLFPLAPNGWYAVGVVAVIIFWSYQGYENVPHMAEEFKNPGRDFQLSIIFSAAITGVLYALISFVTIGTAVYVHQDTYAPISIMFSQSIGAGAPAVTLFLALMLSFGTMNAYSIGTSRLVYALARDRSLPASLCSLNKHAAPARALIVLFAGTSAALLIIALLGPRLDQLFLVTGSGFIALYIMASASAVRLLKIRGLKRIFPYLTLVVSVVVFTFVREYAVFPFAIAGLSLLWVKVTRPNSS